MYLDTDEPVEIMEIYKKLTPLNCDNFIDNLEDEYRNGGVLHYRFEFDNGFGASVIKGLGTFGAAMNLFELAVTRNGEMIKGIDVLGWLNNDQVLSLLEQIKSFVPIETVQDDGMLVSEKLRLVINKE